MKEDATVIKNLEAKAQQLSKPSVVKRTVAAFGVKNIDDLIRKLEADPHVRQVFDTYKRMPKNESILGSLVKGAWGVAKWLLNSVARTITHLFSGFTREAPPMAKVGYASLLLMTFGLAGTLLAAGAPMAVAGGFPLAFSASWWGMMWFGKNFIEPTLKAAEGVPKNAY